MAKTLGESASHWRPPKGGLAFIGDCGIFWCSQRVALLIYTATPCVYLAVSLSATKQRWVESFV
ncbi:hypothetical protein [Treponema sp. R80B11-R83G3]